MQRLPAVLALWACLACSAVPAAAVQPEFADVVRRYDSEDGLPQNSVTSMARTPDGFLWLGTFGGLVRFDGRSFVTHRALAASGPSSDRILRLHVDPRGRLWIGTEDGGITVHADGRFTRLPLCASRCRVNAIADGDDGAVWAATSAGLFRIDRNQVSERLDPRIHAFAEATTDGLLLGAREGLWRRLGDATTPLALPAGATRVTGLGRLDGRIWVGTDRGFHQLGADGAWEPLPGLVQTPDITYAARDAQGRLWLADALGQLLRHDGGYALDRIGMSRAEILSLLLDPEGTLWLGSNGDGLFQRRTPQIGRMQDAASGLDAAALPIIDDGDGGLWLGMTCAGLRHWDPATGEVRTVPLLDSLGSNCVWSLHRDAGGSVWIGSTDGLLGRLQPGADAVEQVARWPAQPSIRAILRSPNGLLVATSMGAYRLAVDDAGQVGTPRKIEALGDTTINAIVPARAGGHWFAGHEGVLRLQDDDVVERWDVGHGLSTRFARSLHEGADGVLWVGTYGGGLNRIEHGRIRRFSQDQGLFDDVVSCIVEDRQGRLWLSGNRGLSLLTGEQLAQVAAGDGSLHAIGYSAGDGLAPAETNGGGQPACHRDRTGRLWFPTLSGLAVVDPVRLAPPSSQAPAIHVEQVSAAGRALPLSGRLLLDSGTRNIEVLFTAPGFTAPEKTRFRYRLSGNEWVDIGDRRSIHFPVMPWGEQVLEIAASSDAGTWSEAPARIVIVNPAPWYLRPLWWTGIVLLVVLLSYAVGWLRTLQLRRRRDALSQLVGERTAALEQANLRLVEQAHSDPLTGIGNHRHFISELGDAWRRLQDSGRPLSLLLIDVDHFKRYNDHFGHLAGDEALCTIAGTMQRELGDAGMLARYGGEEFVVLLTDRTLQDAARTGERLRAAVIDAGLPHAPGEPHATVSISIGCASVLPGSADSRVQLIDRADQALYRAKAQGRNRVECWRDEDAAGT